MHQLRQSVHELVVAPQTIVELPLKPTPWQFVGVAQEDVLYKAQGDWLNVYAKHPCEPHLESALHAL
jgi:hypothetical protein